MKIESTISNKFLLIILFCAVFSINLTYGQKNAQKQHELRQGPYFTEEAGKQNLDHLKKQYSTLEDWKKREKLIVFDHCHLLPSYAVRNNDEVKWK